eukprot:scaffold15297_cov107-Isochrysis_galbana.AAC.1
MPARCGGGAEKGKGRQKFEGCELPAGRGAWAVAPKIDAAREGWGGVGGVLLVALTAKRLFTAIPNLSSDPPTANRAVPLARARPSHSAPPPSPTQPFTHTPALHALQAGELNHLHSAFLTAHGINHGINLRKLPSLNYLYYLCQVSHAPTPARPQDPLPSGKHGARASRRNAHWWRTGRPTRPFVSRSGCVPPACPTASDSGLPGGFGLGSHQRGRETSAGARERLRRRTQSGMCSAARHREHPVKTPIRPARWPRPAHSPTKEGFCTEALPSSGGFGLLPTVKQRPVPPAVQEPLLRVLLARAQHHPLHRRPAHVPPHQGAPDGGVLRRQAGAA